MSSASKWGVGLIVGAFFVGACGSSSGSEGEPSGPRHEQWPARSVVSKTTLGVVEWEVHGTVDRSELLGFDATRSVRVRVKTEWGNDKTLRLDAELPRPWHFEHRDGEIPSMSGPIPPSVAVAIVAGLADDPSEKAMTVRSKLGTLADDPLVTPADPLLKCPTPIDLFGDRGDPQKLQALALILAREYAGTMVKDGACDFIGKPLTQEGRDACIAAVTAKCKAYGGMTAGAMANAFAALDRLMTEQEKAFSEGRALGSCNENCKDCNYFATCLDATSCRNFGGTFRVYPVNDLDDLSIMKCEPSWEGSIFEGLF